MIARGQEILQKLSVVRLHVVITIVSKVGAAAFGAITAAVVGYAGGAAVLGYYALIRVLPAIFVLLTEFGISNSYPYLIKRKGYDPDRVYRSGIFSSIAIATLQLLVWGALAAALKKYFFEDLRYREVLLVGLLAPAQVILLHATNLQRAVGKFKGANLVFVALELAVLAVLVPSLVRGGITIASIIHGVVVAHAAVATSVLVYLSLVGYKFKPKFDRDVLFSSLSYGVRAQVGNAFQVLNYRIDQLIIGGLLGAEALGPYVVAAKSAELFRFFGSSIVFVMEPVLASASVEQAADLVKKHSRRVLFASGAVVIVGMLAVPFLLPIFFGEWAAVAIWPFFIISVGMLISGANGMYAAYNFAVGRPEWNTRIITVGLVVTVLANLALVPQFGAVGAAIAAAAMQVSVTVGFRLHFHNYRQSTRRTVM